MFARYNKNYCRIWQLLHQSDAYNDKKEGVNNIVICDNSVFQVVIFQEC